jgi:hypothetical protein
MQLKQQLKHLLTVKNLSFFLIAFGTLVRLVQYLSNRSIWADEAVLALNIVNRSYGELTLPLDYEQGAPIGFLFLEKTAVNLFGNNEYALRLIPLIAGIGSLFLFYQLAKQLIPKKAIPIALALFASLPHLVYYSSEVKQYSSDVAIALLLFLLLLPLTTKKLERPQLIKFSLIGAIAIWYSHPAIFILAGICLTSVILTLRHQQLEKIKPLAIIFSSWLLSFILFYWLSLSQLTGDSDLMTSWSKAFPSSPLDIIWLLDALGKFFYKPLGFEAWMDGLAIIAFVVGCVVCWQRKKSTLLLLLSPLLMTLAAAYLQQYPFRSRLLLFLTPFFILLIAEGVSYTLKKAANNRREWVGITAAFLAVLLLWQPMVSAASILIEPKWKSEIKPVLSYIQTNQKPGDILYVYQRGIYQFLYYAEKYGYQEGDYILGADDLDKYDGRGVSEVERQRYLNDLNNLRGNARVWLLFSHAAPSENELFQSYLAENGVKIAEFHSKGTSAYLYDLSSP